MLWRSLDKLSFTRLDQEFALLRNKAKKDFRAEHWRGRLACHLSVDVRYRGQGYELNLPFTRGIHNAFRREHERLYGYSYPKRETELVTLRLRASVESPYAKLASTRAGATVPSRPGGAVRQVEHAPIFFNGKKLRAAIYGRESLQPVKKLAGPAVVTEYSATTVIPAGKHFWIDRYGNILIQIKSAKTLPTI